jgi:hypothetical protein
MLVCRRAEPASNRPDDLGLSPVSWRRKAEIIT